MAAAVSSFSSSNLFAAALGERMRVAAERLGVTSYRFGQRELIEAVLDGEDALGVLPTGGGKSLCYELPALVFDRPVVVVSPLIALVKDQRDHLQRAHVDAAELDSTLTVRGARAAAREIRAGAHPIVYVTPERFAQDACIAALKEKGVSLVAVDEAHCVAQWGHDFRPAYLSVARAVAALGRPPILALTATATRETEADIVAQLGLRAPRVVRAGVTRPNLAFRVVRTVNEAAKRAAVMRVLEEEGSGTGIVYTATVKVADELFAWLAAMRVPVARYHGDMSARDREASRAHFMDRTVRVMVATKAFGMGIDKPDIRFVVHYQFPDSLESYVQEAGRAGRDGKDARCVLLYRLEDKRVQSFFLATKYPRRDDIAKVAAALGGGAADAKAIAAATGVAKRKVESIVAHLARVAGAARVDALARELEARAAKDHARLAAMMRYAESVTCRAESIARYFGDSAAVCGRCDICVSKR